MLEMIVVATDGSEHSRKAIVLASDLAGKYGSKLAIVNSVASSRVPADLQHMAEVEHMAENPVRINEPVASVPLAAAVTTADRETLDASRRIAEAMAQNITEAGKRLALDNGAKDVSTAVLDGDPATSIVDYAERANADLIVIGSRGLSDFKGLLVGSVSHKVSQLAKCTCVTVK